MSHDKAIQSGKEHRKPYRLSARFDPACRHQHGTIPCPWCAGNKQHATRKRQLSCVEDEIATILADILVADITRGIK